MSRPVGHSRRAFLRRSAIVGVAGASAGALWGDSAAASAPSRRTRSISSGWRFRGGDISGAALPGFDDASWTPTDLPHTWNAADGEDGGGYFRGPGWYRRRLGIPAGERHYLQFDAANLVCDVWVDGRHAGHHDGGYAAFRFDITDFVDNGRQVLVTVRVDNSPNPDVAPLGGDFSMEGGLYRDVHLITTGAVHIDLLDYGGPGVYVHQRSVSQRAADLDVATRVTNDTAADRTIVVRSTVLDAHERTVAAVATVHRAIAGQTGTLRQPVRLHAPHRWDGRHDPYLYHVRTEILAGGRPLDAVTVPLGVRSFSVDTTGFSLNGRRYALHGVNTHQSSRPGKGYAASSADIDADYDLIEELGATTVRTAHYQHAQRAYENCDRRGLVVWTEIPLVGWSTASPGFTANLHQQLRELIRQTFNNPSVCFLGLGNEHYGSSPYVNGLLDEMQSIVRAEAPDRLSTYAHCCRSDTDPLTNHSDLIGYNRYYGWYEADLDGLGSWADRLHAAEPARRFAVSEYGAGANPHQHEQNGPAPTPGGQWHPEEWQALVSEHNWRAIADRPYLWGSFVWVMFDLPSDGRNEGGHPGINDKGLVTLDRAIRKDAFHWYKANWSPKPMVHITSARDTPRHTATVDVKVYTNQRRVELRVNGVSLGEKTADGHIVGWSGVALETGRNRLEAHTGAITDHVIWDRE